MQLITAKITGRPRTVKTRNGERSVADARAASGENLTIWRPANDPAVMRLADGERVQLAIDSKGKVSLVETAYDRAIASRSEISPVVSGQTIPARPMGFDVDVPFEAETKLRQQLAAAPKPTDSRSAEIADYIDRLGKLYGHCYQAAVKQLDTTAMAIPEVKDVATTLFIQTCKHFQL
jgi:hypothetical protein